MKAFGSYLSPTSGTELTTVHSTSISASTQDETELKLYRDSATASEPIQEESSSVQEAIKKQGTDRDDDSIDDDESTVDSRSYSNPKNENHSTEYDKSILMSINSKKGRNERHSADNTMIVGIESEPISPFLNPNLQDSDDEEDEDENRTVNSKIDRENGDDNERENVDEYSDATRENLAVESKNFFGML